MYEITCYDKNTNKLFKLENDNYDHVRKFLIKAYHSKHLYCLTVNSQTNDTSELLYWCRLP